MFTLGVTISFFSLHEQVLVSGFCRAAFIQLALLLFFIDSRYKHFPTLSHHIQRKRILKGLLGSPTGQLHSDLLLSLSFAVLSAQRSHILGKSLPRDSQAGSPPSSTLAG